MRLSSFLFVWLFSLDVLGGGLSAPFKGSRFTGFTQPSTIVEYDHTMDNDRKLVDLSGSNYATYSEDFNSWTKTNLTVSTNTAGSPLYNTVTVDTLVEATDVAQQHSVRQSISLTSGVKYSFSVYFKAINRTWISLYVGTDTFQTFCDAASGVTGTTSSSVIAKNQSLGSGWHRCSMQFTATATAARDLYIYIAEQDNDTTFDGAGQDSVYLWGAQLALTDEWRPGPGKYHTTTAVNKPPFDLDQDGDEYTKVNLSRFQDDSGRRIASNFLYSYPIYQYPSHDALNIFDGDFTITAVAFIPKQAPYYDTMFFRATENVAGVNFLFHYGWNAEFLLTMYNNGGSVEPYGQNSFDDDVVYVAQAVRSNDVATVFVDGKPGYPVNVSGYGIDGDLPFFFANKNGLEYADGDIPYFRIDASALSQEELARQRDAIRGVLAGAGSANVGNRFSRYWDVEYRHHSDLGLNDMMVSSSDTPRMGGDGGGLLTESVANQFVGSTALFESSAGWWHWYADDWAWAIEDEIFPLICDPYISWWAFSENPELRMREAVGGPADYSVYVNETLSLGETYTFSVYVHQIPGGRNWIWLANYYTSPPPAKGAFFNIHDKYIGTADVGVTPHMEILADDWVRIAITTTSTADDYWNISVADDTPNILYVGDGRENFWFWGVQLEAGGFASSYAENVWDTPTTRPADDFTIAPWKLNKGLSQGNPISVLRFEQNICVTSAPCNLYTSEVGNDVFTAHQGDTEIDPDYPYDVTHIVDHSFGDYFIFDGHDDYISLPHASAGEFYPSGDFSIAALITPDIVTGTRTIFSTYAAGGVGGYRLYASNTDVNFYTETGAGNTTCTKAAALTAKDPAFITVSFIKGVGDLDNTCNIYVNSLSVGTSAVMRYPSARNAGVGIAATAVGDDPFDGRIHYIGYHNVALTQAQHNANYATIKQGDALPLKMGNSYAYKKLYLDFDSKCEWSSLSDIGSARDIISISGNTGTADINTNQIRVYGNTDGKIYASIYSKDENTERYMSTTVHADWNQWHSHKIMWDLEDLTRSRLVTEGVYATLDATMTGAKDIEFTDTLIRIGQNYAGTVNGNCKIRNLKLRSTP